MDINTISKIMNITNNPDKITSISIDIFLNDNEIRIHQNHVYAFWGMDGFYYPDGCGLPNGEGHIEFFATAESEFTKWWMRKNPSTKTYQLKFAPSYRRWNFKKQWWNMKELLLDIYEILDFAGGGSINIEIRTNQEIKKYNGCFSDIIDKMSA